LIGIKVKNLPKFRHKESVDAPANLAKFEKKVIKIKIENLKKKLGEL